MKTCFSWHQWGWDHVTFAFIEFTQPTFFPQSGCLICHWDPNSSPSQWFHHYLLNAYSYISRVCCQQPGTPSQLGVYELWCQSRVILWGGITPGNSLMLGLAQHLQILCGLELQPTAAGSVCRGSAVDLHLRSRTSRVQCSLFMGAKFQGGNYSLSIIKDAAVRRGKLIYSQRMLH